MSTPAPPVWDLRRHATAAPDRTAIVCGDARLSYGQLEALSNRFAALFRHLGLQRGDHIATLLGNRPEGLAVAWAAWRSGLYLTPMSTSLTPVELRYLVDDCDARVVLATVELQGLAAAMLEASGGAPLNAPLNAPSHAPVDLSRHTQSSAQTASSPSPPTSASALPPVEQARHWLSLGGSIAGYTALEPLLAASSPLPHAEEPPGALMMYTSGTTGAPKGVIRPLPPADWRGTPPFAADLIALFGVAGDDVRYLSTAPLYHAAPLRFALAVTAGGGCVVVMARFDAEHALQLIEQHGITHSQWVPTMFQRLLALPATRRAAFSAPALRAAIHGAAPCPISLKQAMIDWWGPVLVEYYSGSEGIGLTLIESAEALQYPGSVGRARKGRLHIVDQTGTELAAGATGLVCFSGVAPFAYHKAPEKTAARTLRGQPRPETRPGVSPAEPTALQTFGDVGHVDADGYLYLTDRQDDMIISGGVNIYPQEIEAVIRAVPGVWDCAVVGVADERFGERPEAFVVADSRTTQDAGALGSAVRRHCEERLGRFKQPAALHFVDELPRSPTGKLLRRVLRDRVPADERGDTP